MKMEAQNAPQKLSKTHIPINSCLVKIEIPGKNLPTLHLPTSSRALRNSHYIIYNVCKRKLNSQALFFASMAQEI